MWLKVIKNKVKQDGSISWSLVAADWKDGKETQRRLERAQYKEHGIPETLSYEDAQARVKTLRAQEKFDRRMARRAAVSERLQDDRQALDAFLPLTDIAEFERKVLGPKYFHTTQIDPKSTLAKKWRAALKCLAESKLDPSDFHDQYFNLFNVFLKHSYSPDYCDRIISLLNEYGYYYCGKYPNKRFLPLPKLRGKLRAKLSDASRKERGSKKSDPIEPSELEKQQGNLLPENYNWLYVSIWLGLRPEEVDELNGEFPYQVTKEGGVKVLNVYQPKLVLKAEEERWKLIPIITPEQTKALKLIESKQPIKRPLNKVLKKYFSGRTTTYAGRKGFVDLMKEHGQSLEDISQWMGHHSLDTTWQHYKNKKRVHFKKVG